MDDRVWANDYDYEKNIAVLYTRGEPEDTERLLPEWMKRCSEVRRMPPTPTDTGRVLVRRRTRGEPQYRVAYS